VLAAFAALILSAALPATALAAPTWLAPSVVGAAVEEAEGPRVAVDATGDAVVVWTASTGGGEVVRGSSRPAGGSWSAPTELSPPGGGGVEWPVVAIDPEGDTVAVWTATVGAEKVIEAVSRPAGGSWSPPAVVSTGGGLSSEAQVAIDAQGEAVAVWDQSAAGKEFVRSSSRPSGGAWSAPVDVSLTGSGVSEPTVGVDADGDAVSVWGYYDGTNHIIQSSTRPPGGPWSAPVGVSPPGEDPEELSLEVDPRGDAVAVWENYLGLGALVAGAYRPSGGPWSASSVLSAPAEVAFEPTVAIGATGEAAVVWNAEGGTGALVRAVTRPADGSWSTPLDVSAAGENTLGPEVAVEPGGNAVAVWSLVDGMGSALQAATMPAPGAGWSPPVQVSAHAAGFDQVALAADAEGDALAVWEGAEDIEAAAYDAAGPRLRSLSVPTTGTAGVPLSFSVSPLDAWSTVGGTTWSFGDGGSAAGTTAAHTYGAPGTYTVTVTSVDAVGNTSTATGTVAVAAPSAVLASREGARGRARSGRIVKVKGRVALVALECPRGAACSGGVKLLARAKAPKAKRAARASARPRTRLLTLGAKARFHLAAGRRGTIKVPLRKKAEALVAAAGRRGLTAHLAGSGVSGRAVTLKAVGHRHRH